MVDADKKISQLAEASSLNDSDVMPVVQSSATKKTLLSTIANHVLNVFTMSLGSVTRTVKSAIDTIVGDIGTLNTTVSGHTTSINNINDSLTTINNTLAFTPVRLLSWGTYGNGTHNFNAGTELQINTLMRLWIGPSSRYGVIKACPASGDSFKIYTEDGWLTLNFASSTSVTVSGAGTYSNVREIAIYPSIKLAP